MEIFGTIFKESSKEMKELSAEEAWVHAISVSKTNMKEEDLKILENLGKLLGKTNIERTT